VAPPPYCEDVTNVDPANPGPRMPAAPVPDDPAPYAEVTPPPRPDRRGLWLGAFIVTLLVLLAGLCGVLFRQTESGSSIAEPAPPPPTPSTTSAAPPVEVVYLVTSTGRGDLARVEYTDQDRDIIRKGEVSLPWRLTFEFVGDKPPLVLIAQRKEGGTGPVTCSITVGGKELTTAVQRGRYAAPQCSA
jgi:hypothetical protein